MARPFVSTAPSACSPGRTLGGGLCPPSEASPQDAVPQDGARVGPRRPRATRKGCAGKAGARTRSVLADAPNGSGDLGHAGNLYLLDKRPGEEGGAHQEVTAGGVRSPMMTPA